VRDEEEGHSRTHWICRSHARLDLVEPTETMSKGDAMRFPIVGSCVLFGLFLLFKFLPARIVNALLSFYLGGVAVFVLVSAVTPYVVNFFPEVSGRRHSAVIPRLLHQCHVADHAWSLMYMRSMAFIRTKAFVV